MPEQFGGDCSTPRSTTQDRDTIEASPTRTKAVAQTTQVDFRKRFPCDRCGKTFSTAWNVKQHMSTIKCTPQEQKQTENADGKRIKENGPNEKTTPMRSKRVKRKHSTSGNPDAKRQKRPYKKPRSVTQGITELWKKGRSCPECKTQYKYKKGLADHLKSSVCLRMQEYECGDCGRIYRRKGDLAKHYLSRSSTPVTCPSPATFPVEYLSKIPTSLTKKAKQRTPTRRGRPMFSYPAWRCTLCDDKFLLVVHCVEQHMVMHKLVAGHKCKVCGREFAWASRRDSHVKNVHKDKAPLPFICRTASCGRRFKYDKALANHSKSCRASKPRDDLKRRTLRRLKSEARRPAIKNETFCGECNKNFSTKNNRIKHQIRVHKAARATLRPTNPTKRVWGKTT